MDRYYKFASWVLITISRCSNFLLNNSFLLFSTNSSIAKSYTIFKDTCNMRSCHQSVSTHSNQMCDKLKFWTLVIWRCLAIYYFHMPWTMRWYYTSNCARQFHWSRCNYFLRKIGILANSHEMSNYGNISPFIFFYMVLIGHKGRQMLVFMLDPRFKICM